MYHASLPLCHVWSFNPDLRLLACLHVPKNDQTKRKKASNMRKKGHPKASEYIF